MAENKDEYQIYRDSAAILRQVSALRVNDLDLDKFLSVDQVSLWQTQVAVWAGYNLPEAITRRLNHDWRGELKNFWRKYIKSHLKLVYVKLSREKFLDPAASLESIVADNLKPKLLFLILEPRQLIDLEPLINRLHTDFHLIIVASKYRLNLVKPDTGKYALIYIEDYHSAVQEKINTELPLLRLKIKSATTALKKIKTTFYSASIYQLIKSDWYEFKVFNHREWLKDAFAADYILKIIKPKAIISADDCNPRHRGFLQSARAENIPTIIVQQGFLSPKSAEWAFNLSQTVAVVGEESRKFLVEFGLAPDHVIVTGIPRFDAIAQFRLLPDEQSSLLSDLKLDPVKPIITFISQPCVGGNFPSEQVRQDTFRRVYEVAALNSSWQLLVKTHPDEDYAVQERLIASVKAPNIILAPKTIKLYPLLKVSRVVIVYQSTVGLEALLMQKPLIVYDENKKFDILFFVKSGLAEPASDSTELAAALNRLCDLSSSNQSDFAQKLNYYTRNFDGLATERVINLVKEKSLL
ncbi:TPA: hypothetical protein DF272_03325 [Candidatus Falkowbacteria bacterium]|nr:hypothetical protein [Candidatus Falkowbacteria bacterium]